MLTAQELYERASRIRLVISDNDGVWTDGTVFVGESGEVLKQYSVRDGMGVERLRNAGIATGILTREAPTLIAPRVKKLELPYLWCSVRDKAAWLARICDETRLTVAQLAYVGDDVNDLAIIQAIGERGLTAAPADAMLSVVESVHYVCHAAGGRGAFREVAEWLLRLRNQGGSP